MLINTYDLEEARLIGGSVVLRWCWPNECMKEIMPAQEYHEMLRDFDNAISIIEQEFLPEAEQYKLARAMRKRWFP
jgi:hypothetical protein